MRLLLDTQVALFALADPEKLTVQAHDLIADSRNAIFVSVVSLWEISLKHAQTPAGAAAMPIGAERAVELGAGVDDREHRAEDARINVDNHERLHRHMLRDAAVDRGDALDDGIGEQE